MSEMIDRVAKAMVNFLITKDPTTPPWEEADEEMRDAMREAVRPQIEAMREPTEAMVDVGETTLLILSAADRIDNSEEVGPGDKPNVCIWRNMIDAALK